eukprot:6813403-Ditylum_brightwellii.AAC.1
MDPTNVCRTLQQDDFDDYVTSSKDPDTPLAEIVEEVSDFGNGTISTSNIGEYAVEVLEDTSLTGAFQDMHIS